MKSLQIEALFLCVCLSGLLAGCGGGSSGGSGGGGGGGGTNPTPAITSISPSSAPQSGAAFTLTVSGSGFVSSSKVEWGQTALTTTYASSSSLTAQIPASDLATQGTYAVTVTSPAPGGGTSGAANFSVGNPVPVVSAIQPASAMAGSAAITLNVSGSEFLPTSQVQWNGSALATTYVSATALSAQVPAVDLIGGTTNVSANVNVVNPSPDGGKSAPVSFEVLAPLTYVRKIDLPANDIVWDGTHGKLYASLPSADTNGNSVVAIDPVTGTVGTPQPAGKEPDALALSDDNSFIYVGLDGTGTIARFTLPNLTPDSSLNIQLPNKALGLAVAPGSPHTLAVRSPSNTVGAAIYDDSTQRPNVASAGVQDLRWGADASVLYGSADDTGGIFRVLSVDSTGITQVSNYPNLDPTFGNIHFDRTSGLAYIDGGWVIDPAHASVAGAFNLLPMISYFNIFDYWDPLCALDPQNSRVFFLGQTLAQEQAKSGVTIEVFDAKTYALLGMLPISGPKGYPDRFIRWGTSGLAFTMGVNPSATFFPGGGPIYLVDGNFVNPGQSPDSTEGTTTYALPNLTSISPQGAVIGSPAFTLTVTGSGFFPSSQILWGNVPVQTTFVSSTELQTSVFSGDLTNPGNVAISVSDTVTLAQSAASLAFAIFPPGTGTTTTIPMNFASVNVAWDSKSQQLLLPVWSVDTQVPNTVVAVNPFTGTIAHTAQVQPNPYAFGVTDDGSYVYAGYAEANSITRFSLPGVDSPMSWRLPTDPLNGPVSAFDLQAEPGAAHTIAVDVSSTGIGIPPPVTVYDDGVARTQTASGGGYLEWGAGNTTLYGSTPSTADWLIDTFDVNAEGVTWIQRLNIGPAPTVGSRVHFDATTGYLYEDNGYVYDPVSATSPGNYNASGYVALDSAMNRVFILGQDTTGSYAIESYNKSTFTRVGYMGLPALVGTPVAFIRWGDHGLAIVTDNSYGLADAMAGRVPPPGILYIISDSSFVSANAVPAAGVQDMPPVHSFERPDPFAAIRRR